MRLDGPHAQDQARSADVSAVRPSSMADAGTRPVMPWSVRTSTKCSRGFDGGVMIGSRSAFTPARYSMRCRPSTCTRCGLCPTLQSIPHTSFRNFPPTPYLFALATDRSSLHPRAPGHTLRPFHRAASPYTTQLPLPKKLLL